MSSLDPGHPLGYIFRRETQNHVKGWKPVIDRCFTKSKNLFRKNLYAHFGCVNAIEFSRDGQLMTSGGDDRRVLLWKVNKAIYGKEEPSVMQAEHGSNVFALALDNANKKIFSAGNDDQVIVHDVETCVPLDYFVHEQPVYGVSIDPLNDCIFASAGDDGRLLVYDIREATSSDPFCLANVASAFHAVMFHPTEPRLLVSGNSKEGVALWDIRKPKTPVLRYGGLNTDQCCMSARFNSDGSNILALRRRLPPVLYATHESAHLFQFNHTGYYNSCTMKSCAFAGTNDQFVLSGSDNFDLYLWKIPPEGSDRWVDEAHLILRGHRSIVNQVRYNKVYSVIVSSGVEKLIKVWSPFAFNSNKNPGRHANFNMFEKERKIYSHSEYINLVTQSGQFMSLTYDIARKSTREDPRMMAFFDALVQRDIEGWSDDSDNIADNAYAAVSELESSDESSTSEEESTARNTTTQVLTNGSIQSLRISRAQIAQRRPTNSEVEDDSDTDDEAPVGNGDLILTQSTISQDLPLNSTQDPNRPSGDEDDDFKRNFEADPDLSAPIVNNGNIIKELISRKHERLRQLAKAHVVLESTLKKPNRKRKSMYSSTSSESDSDIGVQSSKKRNIDNGETSTGTSASASGARTLRSRKPELRRSSQDSSNNALTKRRKRKLCSSRRMSNKNLLKNFKRLRYEKKTTNGESKSSNFCSYFCRAMGRYHHPEPSRRSSSSSSTSSSSTSSSGSDDKPGGSSTLSYPRRKREETASSSSTSSTSSSATSSSDSESENSSYRQKPRPCSSPNLIPKKEVESSDSSDDSSQSSSLNRVTEESSEEALARLRNSPAFKLSPLIRRIEIERLKKIRRLESRKAGGNHFSTKSQGGFHQMLSRTWTSSSSGASSDDGSHESLSSTQKESLSNSLKGFDCPGDSENVFSEVSLSDVVLEVPLENLECSEEIIVDESGSSDLLLETSLFSTSRTDPTSDYDSELHEASQRPPNFSPASCQPGAVEEND